MRFALTSALKDLRRRLADPAALLMWMGLPIVIGGLMSLINGGSGPAPKAQSAGRRRGSVARERADASAAAGRVSSPSSSTSKSSPRTTAARRIDKGDASALLTIPKGFQEGVLHEQPAHARARHESRRADSSGHHRRRPEDAVEAVFYVQRIFGEQLREIADSDGRPRPARRAKVSRAIGRAFNDRIRTVQATLVPPVLTLETKKAPKDEDPELLGAVPPRPAVHVADVHRAGHEHRHLDREDRRHAAARAVDAAARGGVPAGQARRERRRSWRSP